MHQDHLDHQNEWDWSVDFKTIPIGKPEKSILFPGSETDSARSSRMGLAFRSACYGCSSCDRGRTFASAGDKIIRDPHVPPTGNWSKVVFVFGEPAWPDVLACEPIGGSVWRDLARAMIASRISIGDIHLTHVVKCVGSGDNVADCENFLNFEILSIKPSLVVVFGQLALDWLCPGFDVVSSHGKIIDGRLCRALVVEESARGAGLAVAVAARMLAQLHNH